MSMWLDAKVRAVNAANAAVRDVYAKVADVVRPLVGTKVFKADGSFTVAFAKLLPPLGDGRTLTVTRANGSGLLGWRVQAAESDGCGGTVYHVTQVYVGRVRDGVLYELHNAPSPEDCRTDYTAAGITKAREAVRAARADLDAAERKLRPFDEYDR